MSKYTPFEKKIWQAGFYKGLQTAKNKYGISFIDSQLANAKINIEIYIDAARDRYVQDLDRTYKKHKRFTEEEFNEEIEMNRTVLQFLDFCQSVGISAFLDYLRESVYFEKNLFENKGQKIERYEET